MSLTKSLPDVEPQSKEKKDRPKEAPKPMNALHEQEDEQNPEHQSSGKDKTLQKETYQATDRLNRHTDKLPTLYRLFEIALTERQSRREMIAKEFAYR